MSFKFAATAAALLLSAGLASAQTAQPAPKTTAPAAAPAAAPRPPRPPRPPRQSRSSTSTPPRRTNSTSCRRSARSARPTSSPSAPTRTGTTSWPRTSCRRTRKRRSRTRSSSAKGRASPRLRIEHVIGNRKRPGKPGRFCVACPLKGLKTAARPASARPCPAKLTLPWRRSRRQRSWRAECWRRPVPCRVSPACP